MFQKDHTEYATHDSLYDGVLNDGSVLSDVGGYHVIELNEISRKCQAMNKLQANCWTPTWGVLSSVFVNYLSGTERKSSWDFLHFPKFEQHRIYEQRNWFVKLFCGSAQHPQSYSALWRGAARKTAQRLCFSLLLSNTHMKMTDIRIRIGGYSQLTI